MITTDIVHIYGTFSRILQYSDEWFAVLLCTSVLYLMSVMFGSVTFGRLKIIPILPQISIHIMGYYSSHIPTPRSITLVPETSYYVPLYKFISRMNAKVIPKFSRFLSHFVQQCHYVFKNYAPPLSNLCLVTHGIPSLDHDPPITLCQFSVSWFTFWYTPLTCTNPWPAWAWWDRNTVYMCVYFYFLYYTTVF